MVDEPGGKEVAEHGRAPTNAYVLAVGSLPGCLERLGRRCVKEMERRAALHFDRRPRVMGQDQDWCVERWVGTPPAPPLRVLVPSRVAELPGPHDLGADPRIVPLDEGVVNAAAARLREPGTPPPSVKHPLMQPFAGVAEGCVAALPLTSAKAVERDGEV